MRLIVIRGPAGCGKTEIATALAERLMAEVIHADWLKTAIQHRHPEITDRHRIRRLAYKETIGRLEQLRQAGAGTVIVEELLTDPDFVDTLRRFGQENATSQAWFRLKRDLDRLLRAEASDERQSRPWRNSLDDLLEMERQLDDQPVAGEAVIDNNGPLSEAVEEILDRL